MEYWPTCLSKLHWLWVERQKVVSIETKTTTQKTVRDGDTVAVHGSDIA